jgi:hypothetical protein
MTVPTICKAIVLLKKQNHPGKFHSQYPTVDAITIATAAKNISRVGFRLPGGPKNSLGTVRGFIASDTMIFPLLYAVTLVQYKVQSFKNKVL